MSVLGDYPAVTPSTASSSAALHNDYIVNTTITFEEEPVSAADIEIRITDYTRRFPWLVCEEDGVLRGYCYATRWRLRSAYRFRPRQRSMSGGKITGRALARRFTRT